MQQESRALPEVLRHPALRSFGITCLYFLAGSIFFTPFFQTSDDVVMSWITRGVGLVDHPSEFLMLVNVAVGLALKTLYGLFPRCPWYGLGLYGVFFVSVWSLLAALLSRPRSPWVHLWVFVLGTPVFFQCFAWPQYTIYCFLAAQSGMLLFAQPFRPRKAAFAAGGFLLFCASLIRLRPMLFTVLLGAPFLLKARASETDPRANRERLRWLAAAAFLVLSGFGFDWFYYHAHPAWEEARRYYFRRFSISEIKVTQYERQKQAFQSVGWSKDDYRIFKDGLYYGPLFTLERLRELDGRLHRDFRVKFALLKEVLQNNIVRFLLWGLGLCACVAGLRKPSLLLHASWVLLWAGLLFALEKIVARVLWPQLFFGSCLLLFSVRDGEEAPRFQRILPYLFSALLVFPGCRIISRDHAENKPGPEVHRWIADSLKSLSPRKDQLFVVWGSSFPFVGFPVFHTGDDLSNLKLIWMWWFEKTPYTRERLAQFHIRDFLKDMVDRPDVFWLMNNPPPDFSDYLKEQYGIHAVQRKVFHGYFDVYRILTVSPARTLHSLRPKPAHGTGP